MINLYEPKVAEKKEKTNKIWIIVAIMVAISSLVLCIIQCVGVNPLNSNSRMLTCVIIAVSSGWIDITLVLFVIIFNRNLVEHYDSMLNNEGTTITGTLSIEKKKVRLGDINVFVGYIDTGDEYKKKVFIYENHIDKVRKLKGTYTFTLVYNFITQYEEGGKDETI